MMTLKELHTWLKEATTVEPAQVIEWEDNEGGCSVSIEAIWGTTSQPTTIMGIDIVVKSADGTTTTHVDSLTDLKREIVYLIPFGGQPDVYYEEEREGGWAVHVMGHRIDYWESFTDEQMLDIFTNELEEEGYFAI